MGKAYYVSGAPFTPNEVLCRLETVKERPDVTPNGLGILAYVSGQREKAIAYFDAADNELGDDLLEAAQRGLSGTGHSHEGATSKPAPAQTANRADGVNNPPPTIVPRTAVGGYQDWSDATGQHHVEARLLASKDGWVLLERKDGRKLSLPVGKLSPIRAAGSDMDRVHAWIRQFNPEYTGQGKFQHQGTRLAAVDLTDCNIEDLTPLASLPPGILVVLEGNPFSDLSPLKAGRFRTLRLRNCPNVSDLTPLAKTRIDYLDLSRCAKIADLSPLRDNPLKRLFLQKSGISDIRDIRGMPLEALGISPEGITAGIDVVADISTLRFGMVNEKVYLSPQEFLDAIRQHDDPQGSAE
jgi:hypothetical protein